MKGERREKNRDDKEREKDRAISRQDTYSPAFASLVFDGSRWWHDYDVVVCTFQSVLVEMVCTLSIMRVAASYGQSHVTSGLAGATTQYTSGDTISKSKVAFCQLFHKHHFTAFRRSLDDLIPVISIIYKFIIFPIHHTILLSYHTIKKVMVLCRKCEIYTKLFSQYF